MNDNAKKIYIREYLYKNDETELKKIEDWLIKWKFIIVWNWEIWEKDIDTKAYKKYFVIKKK